MNAATPANSTISSNRARTARRLIPSIAALRKTLSRPVRSGWNPVPISSSDPTRPRTVAQPVLGSVMRDRILRSVLFPAPLRPTTPTTSPGAISNDTSRSAQIVAALSPPSRAVPRAAGRPR